MDGLNTVAAWLRQAERPLVLTGAGVSAESGIPTFRGAGGLWEGFRAEELASPAGFAADPERVWRWYRMRRQNCLEAAPNPAHYAIADLERKKPSSFLVTQNIDGLHQRAGSRRVLEMHGSIHEARCLDCNGVQPLPPTQEGPLIPRCALCGGATRPQVLWFGEFYWEGVLETALEAARSADLMIVVGTSGLVSVPAAVALTAQEAGAKLVDINPATSELSEAADAWIAGPAGKVLPALLGRAFV